MVGTSQHIAIRELISAFHNPRVLVILKAYFDESYNEKVFTYACAMSNATGWADIGRGWKLCIEAKNRALKASGRKEISRYHAADCSSLVGEFEGWDVPEQIALTKQLFSSLARGRAWVNAAAFSVPLADFVEHFPQYASDPIGPCYAEMLKFVMLETAAQFREIKEKKHGDVKPVSYVLFHERCQYDGTILEAFNNMVNDQTFKERDMFLSIASMGWEKCLPLQVADMVAYESFKDAEKSFTGRKRRRSLDALLATNRFGGRARQMGSQNVKEWRAVVGQGSLSASGVTLTDDDL